MDTRLREPLHETFDAALKLIPGAPERAVWLERRFRRHEVAHLFPEALDREADGTDGHLFAARGSGLCARALIVVESLAMLPAAL